MIIINYTLTIFVIYSFHIGFSTPTIILKCSTAFLPNLFWIQTVETKWVTKSFSRNAPSFVYRSDTAIRTGNMIIFLFLAIIIWFTSANVIILLWTDFYFSAKLYRAYVSRIVLLTIVAALEFVYFFSLCLPALTRSIYFECNIGPLKYECTGHPGQFYLLLGMWFSLIYGNVY